MGCTHRCVFCDQHAISGCVAFDEDQVKADIETAVATLPPHVKAEIAYFGGSFTALDRGLMVRLLNLAQTYVDRHCVSGIRFSTRPDAVGEDVLDILSHYTISAIELGLQSMDDEVLLATRRGHTAMEAELACRRIVARGYPLVGQMMLGLPASTRDRELATAYAICRMGASAARIYPTVVLKETALARLTERGSYIPLSVEQAIDRCADVLTIFEHENVDVLRVGLCSSDGFSNDRAIAGAYHPALGELAYARLFRRKMAELLKGYTGKSPTFSVARGKLSQAIGQHRENIVTLCCEFELENIDVRESDALSQMQVILN